MCIFQTKLLRAFSSQTVFRYVLRIETYNIMVRLDIIISLVFMMLGV